MTKICSNNLFPKCVREHVPEQCTNVAAPALNSCFYVGTCYGDKYLLAGRQIKSDSARKY